MNTLLQYFNSKILILQPWEKNVSLEVIKSSSSDSSGETTVIRWGTKAGSKIFLSASILTVSANRNFRLMSYDGNKKLRSLKDLTYDAAKAKNMGIMHKREDHFFAPDGECTGYYDISSAGQNGLSHVISDSIEPSVFSTGVHRFSLIGKFKFT